MNRLVPRCSSRASSFHLLRHVYLPPRRFPLSSKPDPCGLLHQSSFLSSPFKTTAWLHSTASRSRASAEAKESSSTISSDDADESKPADYDPSNFDPTECRSPPSQKVLRIVDEIANLTLLEASDLSYLLKKKLGLPDAAMPYFGGGMGQTMSMQPQAVAAAPEEKKPEKTTFDVKLEKFDAASKIKIIKEVRAITSLGLKEAKDVVEKLPAVLKKGVSKEEAEQIVEKFKTVGASVILE